MLCMLFKVEIILCERINMLKDRETCLISLGMTVRLAFSIISDSEVASGFRLIFSYSPPWLLKRKYFNVRPTALKSGVWRRLCDKIFIVCSAGSPPNANGSIFLSEPIEMSIFCKIFRSAKIYHGWGMLLKCDENFKNERSTSTVKHLFGYHQAADIANINPF